MAMVRLLDSASFLARMESAAGSATCSQTAREHPFSSPAMHICLHYSVKGVRAELLDSSPADAPAWMQVMQGGTTTAAGANGGAATALATAASRTTAAAADSAASAAAAPAAALQIAMAASAAAAAALRTATDATATAAARRHERAQMQPVEGTASGGSCLAADACRPAYQCVVIPCQQPGACKRHCMLTGAPSAYSASGCVVCLRLACFSFRFWFFYQCSYAVPRSYLRGTSTWHEVARHGTK